MTTQVRSILRATIMILASFLAMLAVTAPYATAATLFENYQTSDGSAVGPASSSEWVAQTFTATSNHTIRYVQLRGYRDTSLTTGTITASIKATDAGGYPVGPDLTAASEVVTTIPYTAGWFTINLPIIAVTAGTRYAIVVRVSNAAYGSEFWWSADSVSGYPDGAVFDSVNGGTSWTPGGMDLLFNIFGDATTASVQTRAPTANSYPGFDDWYLPECAYTNGECTARAPKNVTHYYTYFNFSIPAGSTITGVEVRLDAWYTASGWPPSGVGYFRNRLSWNNGTSWTSYFNAANVTANEVLYYVGGPTSTWGRSWSPADFANGSFKIDLSTLTNTSVVTYPNQSLGLDYCQVSVYYTPPPPALPTVTTTSVAGISTTTATSGGNVTDDGGAPVTARGVCWSTAANPTIADSCTVDGTGTGAFASTLSGLTPATTYHVRAYATSTAGTTYGNDLPFATDAPLILMIQGTGTGVVHSDPPDINCSSGTCNTAYPFSAGITLTPSATGHSLFGGWSGDCAGVPGDCTLLMDRNRTVLATFDLNPAEAVWVDPGTTYYGAIYNAYKDAAAIGSKIKACRIDFTGNLTFDLGKTVRLMGGYNSDYSKIDSYTTLIGKVTVKSGAVTMENIAIR